MRHALLTMMLCAVLVPLRAQISTFPYFQDFEAFPTNNIFTSPYSEPNSLPMMWVNVQAGDPAQDWYGRSIGTATVGTGPGGDHTTGSGVYLFVEDELPNDHDSVILLTPSFDLTSTSGPLVSYWVHSNHSGGGTPVAQVNYLLVQVNDGSGWMTMDSVGHLGNSWQQRGFSLSGLTGIVQIRFLVNNNNGTNTHDIAIDDFELVDPLPFDAALQAVGFANPGYQQIPASQRFFFSGLVQNEGANPLTNVKLGVQVGGLTDSAVIAALAPAEDSLMTTLNGIVPGQPGTYTATFDVSVAENDTSLANDTASLTFTASDSILARDDSSFINGIGFDGVSGAFGQAFTLTSADTLTSASVYLDNATIGESFRILLFSFNGTPGQLLDSTETATITATQTWYNLAFDCPLVLGPGDYFLAAEQLGTSNLALGFTDALYTPGITWFTTDLASWTAFESVPPPGGPFLVTLGLRMNLGVPAATRLTIDNAPLCEGDGEVVVVARGSANYSWGGQALGDSVVFTPTGDTTLIVTGTDANGCVSTDTLEVVFNPTPDLSLPAAIDLCEGDTLLVDASGSGADTYLWSTGDTTASIEVTAQTAGLLTVQLSSAEGCGVLDSAQLQVLPAPDPGLADTTAVLCFGEAVTLTASNGSSYLWSNGETSAAIVVSPTTGTSYQVEVVDANGCAGADSTFVPVNPEIVATPESNGETGANADGEAWALVTGGTPPYQFQWDDPAAQTDSVAVGLTAGPYVVTITDGSGCQIAATVTVDAVASLSEVAHGRFQVHPNPTEGHLRLVPGPGWGQGPWTLTLLDAQGRLVWQTDWAQVEALEVHVPAELPTGVYQLQMRSKQRTASVRLMLR